MPSPVSLPHCPSRSLGYNLFNGTMPTLSALANLTQLCALFLTHLRQKELGASQIALPVDCPTLAQLTRKPQFLVRNLHSDSFSLVHRKLDEVACPGPVPAFLANL